MTLGIAPRTARIPTTAFGLTEAAVVIRSDLHSTTAKPGHFLVATGLHRTLVSGLAATQPLLSSARILAYRPQQGAHFLAWCARPVGIKACPGCGPNPLAHRARRHIGGVQLRPRPALER